MPDVLDLFLPAVADWFRARYGSPTPPQTLGWPHIQAGEHTLILSPTGSGKTLTAFLWGINTVFEELASGAVADGVRILYISPLKALNNDIERNLREPLAGIRRMARERGDELPPLRALVRTGDTPQSVRQRMVTQPPHILITTPESLYLILTSVRAREMLRSVQTVIVDEIHTLCGNKRGVHLALSLERLAVLAEKPFQRIGLSATQRPLEEVARYLGGQEWRTDALGESRLEPRPVTIVDAGALKKLDLRVVTPVPDLRRMPGNSIWPSLVPQVLNEVRSHRTTLIFTNSRRAAERAADRLNEQYAQEETEEIAPGSPEGLLRDGVPVGEGLFGTGRVGGPFRAHHGSVSKEVRLELEQQLKAGRLPALIGTSSLELGIDIGSVDEVVQIQSPRGVSRGLQRVGRSGHLVGQTSVGRIYATYREDLLDAAAVARGMLQGDIEPTATPQNCLDVLAQQLVAMVADDAWDVDRAYRLACQAYGYQHLTREAFHAVLDMLSGKYPSEAFRELRPRIVWDQVNGRLHSLPGTRLLAINNAGTIPDRGEFRVYLADGKTLLGTLDEEFVFETRIGDVFTLGSNTWRALKIDEDKIVVGEAGGNLPRMPFWRGDAPRRDFYSGLRLGAFRRALAERVADLPPLPDDPIGVWPAEAEPTVHWLMEEYTLDLPSARNAMLYVRHQLDALGAISSDQTVVVEAFADALGDQRLVVHSCFGGRVNSAWALALTHALRERLHVQVEAQVNDDGILFRLVEADRDPPFDLLRSMGPDEARERLLQELPDSALFGSQFRMNAARALLLPSIRGAHRRTPFWLQRLRAKDLLVAARQYPDFPLLAETYRDCLSEVLDLQGILQVLAGIQAGRIRIVEAETIVPSPVSAGLLAEFANVQLYEGDLPKVERQMQALVVNRELLAQLLEDGSLADLLRPEAIDAVERELQHTADGFQARSLDELGWVLHELGDLATEELVARAVGDGPAWLSALAAQGRVLAVELPAASGVERRWVAAEDYGRYRDAFGLPDRLAVSLPEELLLKHQTPEAAWESVIHTFSTSHGPFTVAQLEARYGLSSHIEPTLKALEARGQLVRGHLSPEIRVEEWCDRRVLERLHRRTLSLLRQEIKPVERAAYADLLVRWQGVHPEHHRQGVAGLQRTLQQLRGVLAPAAIWERDVLATRIAHYDARELDALCAEGDWVWVLAGSDDPRRVRLCGFFRGEGGLVLGSPPEEAALEAMSASARQVLAILRSEGACYTQELRQALELDTAQLDAALVELLLAGLVTNDHFAVVRQLLSGEVTPSRGGSGLRSSLEADLRARRAAGPSLGARPSASRLKQARREVARRLPAPTVWLGRWSLVHRQGVLGKRWDPAGRALAQARLLLQRYGLVTREVLQHEELAADWSTLYPVFELLELRGEVRRGYFVRGLSGAQFALPEAVEDLRAWNSPEASAAAALVVLNACDPANLYGSAADVPALEASEDVSPVAEAPTDGATPAYDGDPAVFARLPGNYVVLQRGLPILLYEHGGERWVAGQQVGEGPLREAVAALRDHLTRPGGLCSQPRRLRVQRWNGVAPVGSPMQFVLESLGFRREGTAMLWDGL